MDIIQMYRQMTNQTELLRDAFSTFRDNENVKRWHWAFHEDPALNNRGKGQWCAMMTMQAAMEESCQMYGLSNQDTTHIHFEGFLAWAVTRHNHHLVKAVNNMINFMEQFHALTISIPFESVPRRIKSEWDIKYMQELRATILDELQDGIQMIQIGREGPMSS
jgi:hypothetical protein